MYRLFNDAHPNTVGSKLYPRFDYEASVTQRSVQRLIEYRMQTTGYVDSDHILAKLLHTLKVPYTGDDLRFAEGIKQLQNGLSGGFGLTSYAFRGKAHQGTLFNRATQELLVLINNDIPRDMRTIWETVEPIRVLSSPRSDLSIETLDGTGREDEVGVAVIAIDLPLLALQYEYWKQSAYAGVEHRHRGAPHFLYQFPLTHALKSALDVSIINRLHRTILGYPVSEYRRQLPFAVTHNHAGIDYGLEQVIGRLSTKDMSFEDMLRNIPGVFKPSALEVVQLKRLPYTQQVIWALMIARIDVVSLLLFADYKTQSARNRDAITEIKRDLIRAESGKLLTNAMPSGLAASVGSRIAGQIEPFL